MYIDNIFKYIPTTTNYSIVLLPNQASSSDGITSAGGPGGILIINGQDPWEGNHSFIHSIQLHETNTFGQKGNQWTDAPKYFTP